MMQSKLKFFHNETKPIWTLVKILFIRWKNNEVIPPVNHTDDIISGVSKLFLHNITPADSGTYKCVSEAAISQATWISRCDVCVYSKNIFTFLFILTFVVFLCEKLYLTTGVMLGSIYRPTM